jgi:hypothetical protein
MVGIRSELKLAHAEAKLARREAERAQYSEVLTRLKAEITRKELKLAQGDTESCRLQFAIHAASAVLRRNTQPASPD